MSSRIDQRRQARLHHTSPRPPFHSGFFRLIRVLFLCIGVLFLLGLVVLFILFQRADSFGTTRNILFVPSNLDGKEKSIILAHFSPSDTKIEVAVFPGTQSVDILGGYGSYPLQSVFPLLQLDKKSPAFIRAAYTYALQLPIDEVISFDSTMTPSTQHIDALWWQLVTYKLNSQMSLTDRLRLYRFTQKVGKSKTDIQEVKDENDWKKMLPQFSIPNVASDCGVAVLNTTNIAGTGSTVADVLESSAIPVIRLSDTPDQIAQTKIIVNQPLPFCQEVVTQLGSLFPATTELQIDAKTMATYRAQVVILIGEDFAQEVAKKSH